MATKDLVKYEHKLAELFSTGKDRDDEIVTLFKKYLASK
jgi:hypothetical protein